MALSGTLETMPLPDILQFIGLGRKTGILSVTAGRETREAVFENGRAIFCASNGPKDYLGQHLLARTSLTEEDLEAAFRQQDSSGRPLGEILVAAGRITQEQLKAVLDRKIEDALFDLFTWTSGRFQFEERAVPPGRVPVRIDLDWQDLVMEGARRCDEMARLAEVLPGRGARLRCRRDLFPADFPRTPGDKRIVDLVGRGLTVGGICQQFHSSDLDVMTRLGALVRQGLLEVEIDAPAAAPGVESLLRSAGEHAHAGRLREALGLLREALASRPEDAAVQEALASVERRLRRRVSETAGDLAAIPRLCRDLADLTGPFGAKEAFVLSRVNGQWSVRSIVQICPFDELEVLAILDDFCRRGLLAIGTSAVGTPAGAAR